MSLSGGETCLALAAAARAERILSLSLAALTLLLGSEALAASSPEKLKSDMKVAFVAQFH